MQKHCPHATLMRRLTCVCALWQLETLEQKTKEVKTEEQKAKETKAKAQKPQVSHPSHDPYATILTPTPPSGHELSPTRARHGLNPNPTRACTPSPAQSHATRQHLRSQPKLASQAAIKSKPASYAESCCAKSTVPPRHRSVKATTH